MQKNVSGQKWTVFAFDRTTLIPTTGDASNITAKIGKDGGAYSGINDTNPTEREDGFYDFDLTQAETDANTLIITPVSSTSNIQVLGVPALINTTPVNWADDVVQTGDTFSLIGLGGSGLNDLGGMSTAMKAEVNAEVNTALTDYDGPTKAEMDAAHSLLATSGDLAVVDGIVDAILVDTNELQTNQGDWATATGFSTHSAADVWTNGTRTITSAANITSDSGVINTTSGAIDNVILVDTTTTNTDMRGTDGANTTVPDNASIAAILADTNELQADDIPGLIGALNDIPPTGLIVDLNPDQSAVTIGTVTNVTNDVTTDATSRNASKADLTGIATATNVTDARDAIIASGDANWSTATGFSTHSASDVWANGTRTLSSAANITSDSGAINITAGVIDRVTLTDTTTTNSDMRGTDGANTVVPDASGSITSAKNEIIATGETNWLTGGVGSITESGIWAYANRTLTSAANITSNSGVITVTNGDVSVDFDEIKGSGWSSTTDTLEKIRDAITDLDTGTGTGARSVIIRVNDGTNPIQNAKVRMNLNTESYLSTTDVNGDTSAFGLENDGTWNITITAPGHQSQVTTLAVSTDIAAGDQVYSLTANVISAPSDPSLCRVGAYVQFNGAAEEGATFKAILSGRNLTTEGIVVNQDTSSLTNSSGYAYLDLIRQDQFVDGSGLYEFNLTNSKGRLIFRTTSTIPNSGTANLEDLI